jgi:hypothetical protein
LNVTVDSSCSKCVIYFWPVSVICVHHQHDQLVSVRTYEQTKQMNMTLYGSNLPSGIQKYSKNLGVTSKFQVSEDWHVISFILKTHNSGVICGLDCYLVLSAQCICSDTHFIRKKKNCSYCGENMRSHCTKCSHLGFVYLVTIFIQANDDKCFTEVHKIIKKT